VTRTGIRCATFVLSTGRCGTQWLADRLSKTYGDILHVEHEPLHDRYRPRQMLGARGVLPDDPETAQTIRTHLETIGRHLETHDYVECGHPCWSSIPYLAEQFAGRVRLIHLTRHPIPTALSWTTHQAFTPPLLPHLTEKVLLSPFDDEVQFPEYREWWPTLTPFEKCLYYWAEVNAFGLNLRARQSAPWLTLSYESLFGGDGLEDLLSFLGVPDRESMWSDRAMAIDRFRFATQESPDPTIATRHERVVDVARRLDYDVADVHPHALQRRYLRLDKI
jgi:hypothetical protein